MTTEERAIIANVANRIFDLRDRAGQLLQAYENAEHQHNINVDELLSKYGEQIGSLFTESIDEWMFSLSAKAEALQSLIEPADMHSATAGDNRY